MSLVRRVHTPRAGEPLGATLVVLAVLMALASAIVNDAGWWQALGQVTPLLILALFYAAGRAMGPAVSLVGQIATATLLLGLVITGGSGYPNAAAAMAVQVLAMTALGLRMTHSSGADLRLLAAAGVAGVGLLALLGSTAGIVTGLMVLVAASVIVPRRHVKMVVLATGLVVIFVAVTQVVLAWHGGNDLTAWALSNRRLELWSDAYKLLMTSPLLGNGPGSFSRLSMAAQDPDTRLAHSALMEAGAELGLLGIIALVCLVAWGYWRLAASSTGGYLIGVAAWSALWLHGLVDYVTHFPLVMASAGLVLGASVTLGPATAASIQGADFRRTGHS